MDQAARRRMAGTRREPPVGICTLGGATVTILDSLVAEAKQYLCGRENLRVDNIVLGKSFYTMKGSDTVFTDMNFCLILLEDAYGFSYFQGEIDYSITSFVNRNVLDLLNEAMPIYARVALTDSLYCVINRGMFANVRVLTGDIRQKARKRARILLAGVPKGAKLLLLGAASEIMEEATTRECSLRVLDLEDQKIGLEFFSTPIGHGAAANLQKEIASSDYVIATGMVFPSKTADRIFEVVRREQKKLILYMQTGSNFGPQLVAHGADSVLSEFFPYYDFFGETRYLMFHQHDTETW